MADPVVRLTVDVSLDVADALDELANLLGITRTQALNQAIVTASYLYRAQEANGGQLVARYGRAERHVHLPKPPTH